MVSILYAAAVSAVSRAVVSVSSHRPLSMHAHCSADRAGALRPRTPGARSRLRASRRSLTARSVSSRSQAAAPIRGLVGDWPARPSGAGTGWFPFFPERVRAGSDHRTVHVGVAGWPVRRLRRLVHAVEGGEHCLAAGRGSGVVGDRRGQRDGVPGDDRLPGRCLLGDGDERGSASACRLDQMSAQPMGSRAVMRSSGSVVSVRTRVASSCTQSAWPGGRASAPAASSRRAWSGSPGLSSAARSRARAAAAAPPRRCAWAAVSSSSEATRSSGSSAAAARCQA